MKGMLERPLQLCAVNAAIESTNVIQSGAGQVQVIDGQ